MHTYYAFWVVLRTRIPPLSVHLIASWLIVVHKCIIVSDEEVSVCYCSCLFLEIYCSRGEGGVIVHLLQGEDLHPGAAWFHFNQKVFGQKLTLDNGRKKEGECRQQSCKTDVLVLEGCRVSDILDLLCCSVKYETTVSKPGGCLVFRLTLLLLRSRSTLHYS